MRLPIVVAALREVACHPRAIQSVGHCYVENLGPHPSREGVYCNGARTAVALESRKQ